MSKFDLIGTVCFEETIKLFQNDQLFFLMNSRIYVWDGCGPNDELLTFIS